MNVLETASALAADSEIQEGTSDFLSDSVSALFGDRVAAGKIVYTLANSPFFFREKLFWIKFERFLKGVAFSENERAGFCAKLVEDGKKDENAYRLIQAIDHAETDQKIDYLINASRSLGAGFIDLPLYFRICKAITDTMPEDLKFLAERIQKPEGLFEFDYSTTVQGLLNAGLVYQYKVDDHGFGKYKFTPFADDVDRYAVSYDDESKYGIGGNKNNLPYSQPKKLRHGEQEFPWGTF